MADAQMLVPVDHDPFADAGAIPGLMGKPDAPPQGLGPSVGFGLPIGMAGGVAGYRAGESALDAAMLPGDVYQGKVDLGSEAGLGRVVNMAGTLAGAGIPMAEAGAAGMAGGKLAKMVPVEHDPFIEAYHGSPHSFDQFDLSKIGTGEGAQAYGHGLYFAENEGVARGYRDTLSSPVNKKIDPNSMDPQDIAIAFNRSLGARSGALHADRMARSAADGSVEREAYTKAAEIMRSGDPYAGVSPGSMYHVRINADPEHFLDWDKPLSEQSHLLPALGKAGYAVPPTTDLSYLKGMAEQHGPESWYAMQHDALADTLQKPGSEFAPKTPEHAQALKDAGIPGLKYLDQGSRATTGGELLGVDKTPEGFRAKVRVQNRSGIGFQNPADMITTSKPFASEAEARSWANSQINQGTRNHVVFDDKLVEILRKYGIAGLTTLGGGAAALGANGFSLSPVDHDPFGPPTGGPL